MVTLGDKEAPPSLEVGRRVNGAKCCCTETLGAFYSRYIRDSLLKKSKMAGQETFHVNLKEALSLSTGAEKTTFQKSEVGYISGL